MPENVSRKNRGAHMGNSIKGSESCTCGGGPKLIYSCSGSADVGELADRAARYLSAKSVGKMSCLAGIGGRHGGLMSLAEIASLILVIDGCGQNCAKRTLEVAGFNEFIHLELDKMGFKKGSSSPTEQNISCVVHKGIELLSDESAPR